MTTVSSNSHIKISVSCVTVPLFLHKHYFNIIIFQEKKKRRRNRDNQPKKEIRVAEKKKFIGADVEFRDATQERSSVQLVRVSRDSNAMEDTPGKYCCD